MSLMNKIKSDFQQLPSLRTSIDIYSILLVITVLGHSVDATVVAGRDAQIAVHRGSRKEHSPPWFLVVVFSQLFLNAKISAVFQLAFLTKTGVLTFDRLDYSVSSSASQPFLQNMRSAGLVTENSVLHFL